MIRARRALALIAATAALAACGGSGSSGPTSVRVAWSARVGVKLDAIAAGDGGLWVTTGGHVLRLDPATGRVVADLPVAGLAGVISAAPGAVWAAFLTPDKQNTFVVRIDPSTNQIALTTSRFSIGEPVGIAVGAGGVWVTTDADGGQVDDLDPSTGRPAGAPIAVSEAGAPVLQGTTLWVPQGMSGEVTRIDTSARRIDGRPIRVGGENVGSAVAFGNGIWAGSDATNIIAGRAHVIRVEGDTVTQKVDTPGGTTVQALTAAFGRVWVLTLDGSGSLQALDPGHGQLLGRPATFPRSQAITVVSGQGALWVITVDQHLFKLVPA